MNTRTNGAAQDASLLKEGAGINPDLIASLIPRDSVNLIVGPMRIGRSTFPTNLARELASDSLRPAETTKTIEP